MSPSRIAVVGIFIVDPPCIHSRSRRTPSPTTRYGRSPSGHLLARLEILNDVFKRFADIVLEVVREIIIIEHLVEGITEVLNQLLSLDVSLGPCTRYTRMPYRYREPCSPRRCGRRSSILASSSA